jgi:hypothetical protein
MKYMEEMSPGAITWIPAFIKIGSVIQTLNAEYTDSITLISFFFLQNKEHKLITSQYDDSVQKDSVFIKILAISSYCTPVIRVYISSWVKNLQQFPYC